MFRDMRRVDRDKGRDVYKRQSLRYVNLDENIIWGGKYEGLL